MTEIKLWIAASDCEDVSVTAIFCWCSKYTFTSPRLPTKTLSRRECQGLIGKQHIHKNLMWADGAGV